MERELVELVETQLEPGESVLWSGQPDPADSTCKLLIGSVLLLAAVFAESVSLLLDPTIDSSTLLPWRVAGLCAFTAVCGFLIHSAPARAANVIYVLTNRRMLKLDLNKPIHGAVLEKFKNMRRAVVYERKSFAEGYWFNFLAHAFLACAWCAMVIPALLASSDVFNVTSTVLVALTVAGFVYERRYLPDARWRDPGGILYWVEKRPVFVQDVRLNEVSDVKVRNRIRGTKDLFVVTRNSGCLRLPAINSPEAAERVLTLTTLDRAERVS